MRTKPRSGCGYTTVLPWNDSTRDLIKEIRKGMPPDRHLRIRGRGPMENRPDRSYCPLNKATHVVLYFTKDKVHDWETMDQRRMAILREEVTYATKRAEDLQQNFNELERRYLEMESVLEYTHGENDKLRKQLNRAIQLAHMLVDEVIL